MPNEKEMLVRLCVSSISSGTERANLVGSKTVSWNSPEAKEAVFPRRSGYSSAGVVEKVGDAVTKFKVGDRVALWWSSHSQYMTIKENRACHIDDVSFEDAALFHIATFPLAAIRKCRLEIGESAIVMGMGILGIMAIKLLRAVGAAPIIAVDPIPEKRELALKLGADYAFDPFADNFEEQVRGVTDGGVNAAIEVTGNGKALDLVLDCMAKLGRVALLGCTRNSDFTIDYYKKVHGPGISLIGAHTAARPAVDSYNGYWTAKDDMAAIQRMVRCKRLEFASLVEEIHSPNEAVEVYNRLANEPCFPIVQFDWEK
jgi:2-desacetyl-2-hydroxyethyl bacteriochlorophyllide A dehydrogenase